MAGKKITTEQLAGNTEVVLDLLSPAGTKKTVNTASDKSAAETEKVKESEKDVHLTMLVKESTRKEWKQFFIEHDLNTTQGIEIAVHHLMDDVENKLFKLTKGGLSKIYDGLD